MTFRFSIKYHNMVLLVLFPCLPKLQKPHRGTPAPCAGTGGTNYRAKRGDDPMIRCCCCWYPTAVAAVKKDTVVA